VGPSPSSVQQLPQDVGQDAAVAVILRLEGGIQAAGGGEGLVVRRDGQAPPRQAGRAAARAPVVLPTGSNVVKWRLSPLGFDHRDLRHFPAALRTAQRVNFPHAFDQSPPRLGDHGAQLGRRG